MVMYFMLNDSGILEPSWLPFALKRSPKSSTPSSRYLSWIQLAVSAFEYWWIIGNTNPSSANEWQTGYSQLWSRGWNTGHNPPMDTCGKYFGKFWTAPIVSQKLHPRTGSRNCISLPNYSGLMQRVCNSESVHAHAIETLIFKYHCCRALYDETDECYILVCDILQEKGLYEKAKKHVAYEPKSFTSMLSKNFWKLETLGWTLYLKYFLKYRCHWGAMSQVGYTV